MKHVKHKHRTIKLKQRLSTILTKQRFGEVKIFLLYFEKEMILSLQDFFQHLNRSMT